MIKRILSAALLSCSVLTALPSAERLQLAAEYLRWSQPTAEQITAICDVGLTSLAQGQGLPMSEEERSACLDRAREVILHLQDSMREEQTKIVAEVFEQEELEALIAFSRSPAGRAVLDKMPVLIQRYSQALLPVLGQALTAFTL